jgi:hypothetical protein
MKSELTPVQIKYLFVGTVVFFTLIISGVVGIAMVNNSVDDSHDAYYKIWKGDIDNFESNLESEFGNNTTMSDVNQYLDRNTKDFNPSKNASGVVIPVLAGFVILLVIILVMYDKERKEELLL